MTGRTLVALLSGQEIGRVVRDRQGRLTFTYREEWRTADDALPLSLSMPLAAAEHGHARTEAFLWGLLPDNERVLDRWARQFQVSARNAFALLSHVGEDCAGAVQFVQPDRLDEIQATTRPEVEWLDEAAIAERLRSLRADHSAWRAPGDTGQFSLAGAQPKTALLYHEARWGVPSGRMPTTHILKPPTGEFDGYAENEHLCLVLARELGLPAAISEIMHFEDEMAIVVERYDRVRTSVLDLAKGQPILRLHQEDFCQALGLPPTLKYQAEGGPSPEEIAALLSEHSGRPREDVATFLDALALSWLIGGTDGHAKNYSILHGTGGRVRLAPLYDVASALPYRNLDPQRLRLAMKIGGEYRLRDIRLDEWRKLAKNLRLPEDEVVGRVAGLASRLVERVPAVCAKLQRDGVRHPIVHRLGEALASRARQCQRLLRSSR